MPPRFPHGLTKDPTIMSRQEMSVLGFLLVSTGIGIFQMATSPWGRPVESVMKTEINVPMEAPQTIAEQKMVKEVDDGVTDIKFGGPV